MNFLNRSIIIAGMLLITFFFEEHIACIQKSDIQILIGGPGDDSNPNISAIHDHLNSLATALNDAGVKTVFLSGLAENPGTVKDYLSSNTIKLFYHVDLKSLLQFYFNGSSLPIGLEALEKQFFKKNIYYIFHTANSMSTFPLLAKKSVSRFFAYNTESWTPNQMSMQIVEVLKFIADIAIDSTEVLKSFQEIINQKEWAYVTNGSAPFYLHEIPLSLNQNFAQSRQVPFQPIQLISPRIVSITPSYATDKNAVLVVYNSEGKTVFRRQIINTNSTLYLDHLVIGKGMYILSYIENNIPISALRVVK